MAHGQGLGLKEQNNTLTMNVCHGRFSHKTEEDYSPILQNTKIEKIIEDMKNSIAELEKTQNIENI